MLPPLPPKRFGPKTSYYLPPLITPYVAPVALKLGGAGGWWRPSGLFAALLAALPSLKGALVGPLAAAEAAAYPDMAVKALELLEAGVR